MSGFGTGQFNENAEMHAEMHAELERLRRQQQAAAWSALAARARQPDYPAASAAHLGMLGTSEASSPYYARAPPGYARYAGMPDPAYGARLQPDQNQLAQLHHAVFGRQPTVQQLGHNYAYAAPAGNMNGYTATATPTHRSPADQQRFPYGLASTNSPAPECYDSYAARNTFVSPPKASPNSASSLHRQALAARSSGGTAKVTPKTKTTPGKSPAVTPASSKTTPKTPKSGGSYGSNLSKTSEKSREQNGQKRVLTSAGTILVDGEESYYSGHVPLGLDDDKYWLSELQVYLRSHFAEAFGATDDDVAAPMHGRNKPIVLGQVGIRCKHCKGDDPTERGQQSTSYPSLISGIYNSVQQMLRLHLDCCLSIPPDVRSRIEALRVSCSSRGGRKQYWIDSAKCLGLVDTPDGIHFGRDPHGPLPPLSGPSVSSKEGRRKKMMKASAEAAVTTLPQEPEPIPTVDDRPLVFEEDRDLISDYLYLTLEQMAPCNLMEADRVGCYKTRKVGFPGLACKFCSGKSGCGRYFPATEASLSQTTTSQTIMNHVRNCRRCPTEIRENLELMKRDRMGPDGKRADKPKHGGRKVFFHRLWCRIQGIEIVDEELKVDEKLLKRKKATKKGTKRKKVLGSDGESGDDATGAVSSDDETESEAESEVSDEKKHKRRRTSPGKMNPEKEQWFEGCVRLSKTDDPHWLSEMECFARSDLVELFSLNNKSGYGFYNGRKEPTAGQVGIRCVFCKSLPVQERPTGSVSFPDSLSTIDQKVTDMIRLHFPGCPSLSDEARETFRSLRGFDAKVASDDAQQYWIDSARDIGLANVSPESRRKSSAWGITFRRDPLQPSPADELDLENSNNSSENCTNNSLVRLEDRGLCTDQVILLLRQVVPCHFKKNDRRAGPGSRGRDRSVGFPGLSCKHCVRKNTVGRYFPLSAKNMTDCTSNSLQTHVASCSYCPETIRASLAYLGHRGILQKAELRGCWKKAFFRKIWDRLHPERKRISTDDGPGSSGLAELKNDACPNGDDSVIDEDEKGVDSDDNVGDDDGESESDKEEELNDHMNALIKAAAIWLTEQDAATDSARASARASKQQGRSLPSKRPTNGNSSRRAQDDEAILTKTRRVHF